MTRLFTSGFEESGTPTTSVWFPGTNGTISSAVAPHSGTYYGNCGAAQFFIARLFAAKSSGTLFISSYINTPGVTTSTVVLSVFSAAAAAAQYVVLNADETLSANNNDGVNPLVTVEGGAPTQLTINTWYRIEQRVLISGTATGQFECRLYLADSTTPLHTWGIGNFTGGDGTDVITIRSSSNPQEIRFRSSSAGTTTRHDDVRINGDDAGVTGTTPFNTWAGPGKIAIQKPTGDVAVTWTPIAGANFENVDDIPGTSDDDTTYNSSTTVDAEDRFSISALPAEVTTNADIICVDVYARIRGTSTVGTHTSRVLLWDEDATQTVGPATNMNDVTSYAVMFDTQHLPYAAAGKTKADLANFNLGYEIIAGTDETRVTALWANVEWLETTFDAAIQTTPAVGMLMGSGGVVGREYM